MLQVAQLRARMRQMRREQRIATADFVVIELDLAITFCRIALSSSNRSKIQRNAENAIRARQSALHFLEKTPASYALSRGIRRKFTQLESLLRQIQIDPTADWRSFAGE